MSVLGGPAKAIIQVAGSPVENAENSAVSILSGQIRLLYR